MYDARIEELLQRLRETQAELAHEMERLLAEQRQRFHYSLRRGRVTFERNMRQLQRRYRTGVWRYLARAPLRHILTAPVIYVMIVPIALLDLSVTLYQHICFRAYRIPRVRRRDYLVIDRHRLPYLNAIEKLNCAYCGYGNGVMAYAREIVARTEQYWCPIRHARPVRSAHERSLAFFEYGDAQAYREGLERIRQDWGDESETRESSGQDTPAR